MATQHRVASLYLAQDVGGQGVGQLVQRQVLRVQRLHAGGAVGVGVPPGAVHAGVVHGQHLHAEHSVLGHQLPRCSVKAVQSQDTPAAGSQLMVDGRC
jgi:hypothetical protein